MSENRKCHTWLSLLHVTWWSIIRVHIHFFLADMHGFPWRINWECCKRVTSLLNHILIWSGKKWGWSLGQKELTVLYPHKIKAPPTQVRTVFKRHILLPRFVSKGLEITPVSGFKNMQIQWAGSLVSCGQKADSFKIILCGLKNIQICVNVA